MDVHSWLNEWETFYVILGSAAGALIGLQFVAMALVNDQRDLTPSTDTVDAFSTPTVVHFYAVLLLAAIVSMPWHRPAYVGTTIGIMGALGEAYTFVIIRRAHLQADYKPVMKDWIWHTILPVIAYAGIFLASLAFTRRPEAALFTIGAGGMLLLSIGIHNAWDTVRYVAVERFEKKEAAKTGHSKPETGN